MKILLPTDSFPPNCGGSGWSTYELARGLIERGHDVLVVKVIAGKSGAEGSTAYNGIPVIEYHAYAPAIPGVRNYFKNERLYPRLADRLDELIAATISTSSTGSMSSPRRRPSWPRGAAAFRVSSPSAITGRSATGPT